MKNTELSSDLLDEMVSSISVENRHYVWHYRYAPQKKASTTIELDGRKKNPVIRIDGTPANAEKEASDEASDIHSFEKSIVSEYEDKKSSLTQSLHRLLLSRSSHSQITLTWDFTVTYEMAKAWRKARGAYLRQGQWTDITMRICIDVG